MSSTTHVLLKVFWVCSSILAVYLILRRVYEIRVYGWH